jgi:hypothetical protein
MHRTWGRGYAWPPLGNWIGQDLGCTGKGRPKQNPCRIKSWLMTRLL